MAAVAAEAWGWDGAGVVEVKGAVVARGEKGGKVAWRGARCGRAGRSHRLGLRQTAGGHSNNVKAVYDSRKSRENEAECRAGLMGFSGFRMFKECDRWKGRQAATSCG